MLLMRAVMGSARGLNYTLKKLRGLCGDCNVGRWNHAPLGGLCGDKQF